MQQESLRVCKVCGGPNHYGCGCEAKAKRAANHVETEHIEPTEQPASEAKPPAKSDELDDMLSPEAILKDYKSYLEMTKDIKTMADGFEGLCALLYDTNNYLKLIAGDMITIRKILSKEDKENEFGMGDIGGYLSVINQRLEEIKANMVKVIEVKDAG